MDDERVADDMARFTDGIIQLDLSEFEFEHMQPAKGGDSTRNKKKK